MTRPTMYKARFILWDGKVVVDDMGWTNKDGEREKAIRENICQRIVEGLPFWTYSHIIFPDSLRLVEFFRSDE